MHEEDVVRTLLSPECEAFILDGEDTVDCDETPVMTPLTPEEHASAVLTDPTA